MSDIFHPGDQAPYSGVYKVTHAGEHTPVHHVSVLHGEPFPSCIQCLRQVSFELFFSAVHINAHPMFNRL